MSGYYDKDGTPISDVLEWAKKNADSDYKRIAATNLPDGRFISTVWLGLDHSFIPDGPPLIFETMVFASDDDPADEFCERYTTEEEAKAGHQRVVKTLEAGRNPNEVRS